MNHIVTKKTKICSDNISSVAIIWFIFLVLHLSSYYN